MEDLVIWLENLSVEGLGDGDVQFYTGREVVGELMFLNSLVSGTSRLPTSEGKSEGESYRRHDIRMEREND